MDTDRKITEWERFKRQRLRVGQYIVQYEYIGPVRKYPSMFGEPIEEQPEYSGMPAKIVSIDYPFIALTQDEGRTVFTSDLRVCRVKRVKADYGKSVLNQQYRASNLQNRNNPGNEPDQDACPRCGERLRERLITLPSGSRSWVRICPNCDGGPQSQSRIVMF
jgi:hypothetical protein